MNILDIKLQHYFKAIHLLQQCCLSNIPTIMDYRPSINTIYTYKDMYEYFRHGHFYTKGTQNVSFVSKTEITNGLKYPCFMESTC